MTTTILLQNKLIAEFLDGQGCVKSNRWVSEDGVFENLWQGEYAADYRKYYLNIPYGSNLYIEDTLFHEDFDWLREVRYKIHKLNYATLFSTNPHHSVFYFEVGELIKQKEGGCLYVTKMSVLKTNKVETVYEGVLKFINWYNDNRTN